MAVALPTRIKQNLRDQITSPTSPVATKTASVQQTLGYPIELDPEWGMLWKGLQPYFPEAASFIPYVANVLIAWCDGFMIWLENGENEEVVEKFLEGVRGGRVLLCLEISPSQIDRPTTTWNPLKALFIITFPKSTPIQTHTILYGFNTDFTNLFTSSPTLPATDPTTITTATTKTVEYVPEEKEWSHLTLDSPSIQPIRTKPAQVIVPPGDDFMPEMSMIPRPEDLLKRPPYWMVVRQEGRTRVTVNSSHGGSLTVLETYLKRWCRGESGLVDRPPIVTIKLHECAFGLGLLNDTLTLETNGHRGREVSAMLILVFVETVLGYEAMPTNGGGSAGSVWEFRRTRGFK